MREQARSLAHSVVYGVRQGIADLASRLRETLLALITDIREGIRTLTETLIPALRDAVGYLVDNIWKALEALEIPEERIVDGLARLMRLMQELPIKVTKAALEKA